MFCWTRLAVHGSSRDKPLAGGSYGECVFIAAKH